MKMEKTQFQNIAIEFKTRSELRSIAKKTGKKIYAIVAEAIEAYKKNLS
jgi:predicted DNA-binding protein